MRRLSGRRALITGASRGIGGAIAMAFAIEGADLCLNDLQNNLALTQLTKDCASHGVRVFTEIGDVSDSGAVARIVRSAQEQLGGIDILVNNAGILTESPVETMNDQMWDDMLRVDLRSVFLCSREVLPGMLDQGFGRIINIASQLALKGGVDLAHYSAAKAGIIGLTKSLAREVAGRGVNVNAIAPGPIETPLLSGISEEWRVAKKAELPLGRFGRPEEVAPTAVLLASDPDGNLYVGQTLGPNSGDVMP
jgi:3-oxoacyl-[acyl-carrier protein] reductase